MVTVSVSPPSAKSPPILKNIRSRNNTHMRKNIRVEIKIKNNILYRLIMKESKSVSQFCEKYDLCQETVGKLLSFKRSPRNKYTGEWRRCAIRLSEIFRMLPEDIFDEEFEDIQKNTISIEGNLSYFDGKLTAKLEAPIKDGLADAINDILRTLPAREKKVIEMRYGLNGNLEMTLEDIGDMMGVGRERIRQIEAKALRRLRHPTRARKLVEYMNNETVQ